MKRTLSRKKKIAITAGVVASAAVAIFFLSREQAVGKGGAVKFERVIPIVRTVVTETRRELPRRQQRPSLRAQEGWPFEQLPMIAKFDVPVAHVVPSTIIARPVYIKDVPPIMASTPVEDPSAPPLWLVPVGAGGIGFGGGSTTYSTTVPEPVTLLLLSGGLALIGLKARRREGD